MVLTQVLLSNDVYMACLQLALSTEKEEVICLLLGETKPTTTHENEVEAYIYAMRIPCRSDKKKDRVEISPDQLIAAREYAEQLSQRYNREVRVLGWFHSHPHITVWPSHVDVTTQANYQTMSRSFVGIISSVFSEDKNSKECEVNLTCFQSESITNGNDVTDLIRKPIPFVVVPNPAFIKDVSCLKTISYLPNILVKEEEDSYKEVSSTNCDALSALQNDMLLTKTLFHIVNKISIPLLKTLETTDKVLQQRIYFLNKYKSSLCSSFGGCHNNIYDS